ncbi:ParA family protein [Halosegnis longus]|uniref:ParA family protein n=1 Tax=Halosegnis longus TaxID=2216012 RepID=UPI001F1BF539|nr:ParA family protein [Halosegnis longus]
MTARVAMYSAKGGTGKTTTAINLMGACAAQGLDVLLVDIDPQGNATEALGFYDEWDATAPTMFDVLLDGADPEPLLLEHEECTVLPSNMDLLTIERELAYDHKADKPVLSYLDQALAQVDDEFDLTIIDCPPSFGFLTDSALYAAGSVVIPALAESTSQRAVELLLKQIVRLEGEVNAKDSPDAYDPLRVAEVAAVANRVETTGDAERMVEWMQTTFSGTPVFEVRKRVALRRAIENHRSIHAHNESCDMESVYDDLAETVLDHVGIDHQTTETPQISNE